jgi:hypothetical protein
MLREELDGILMFIGEATLSDTEWQQVKSMIEGQNVKDSGSKDSRNTNSGSKDPADIDSSKVELKNKYQALYACVKERCGEGNSLQRLNGYFVAKGVIDSRVIDINVFDPRVSDFRVNALGASKSSLSNIIVGGVLE